MLQSLAFPPLCSLFLRFARFSLVIAPRCPRSASPAPRGPRYPSSSTSRAREAFPAAHWDGSLAPGRRRGRPRAFFVPRSDQKMLVTHQQKPSLEVLGVSENNWSKYRLVEIPLPRRATSQGRHPTCIAHPPGVGKRPRLVELEGWLGLRRGMRRRRGRSRPKSVFFDAISLAALTFVRYHSLIAPHRRVNSQLPSRTHPG